MAYISPEQVKEIRKEIRTKYPKRDGWKISVRGKDYMCVDVSILEAPRDLDCGDYSQINHYNLSELKEQELFEDITSIAMRGNHNNSDAMTDYFDVGWYFHLSVGDWDKPLVVKTPQRYIDRMNEQLDSILGHKPTMDMPGFEGTLDALDILCDIKTITDDYASKHLNKK